MLLTTHYLDEAEHLADRVGVLSAGRLIAEGTPGRADQHGDRHGRVVRAPRRDRGRELGDAVPSAASVAGRRVEFSTTDADRGRRRAHWLGARPRARVGGACRSPGVARGRVPGPRRRRPGGQVVDADGAADERLAGSSDSWCARPSTSSCRSGGSRSRCSSRSLLPLIMLVLFNALFGDARSRSTRTDMADPPVLHRRARRLHGRVGDVHEPRQHGADPARGRRAQALAGHAAADVDLPRRVDRGSAVDHRLRRGVVMLASASSPTTSTSTPAKMPAAVATFLIGVASFAALGMASPPSSSRRARRRRSPTPSSCRWRSSRTSSSRSRIHPRGSRSSATSSRSSRSSSFQDAFNPLVEAPAFDWAALACVAVWGIAGLVVALKTFRWEPARAARPVAAAPVRRPSKC